MVLLLLGTIRVLSLLACRNRFLDRSLDLGSASFHFLAGSSLRHHRVQFESLLVQPLALFLQEVCISNKHSSNLAQILRFLVGCRRRVCILNSRARFQMVDSSLDQALHILCLQFVEHGVCGPIVVHNLE